MQVYNPPVNFQSVSFSDLHESDGRSQGDHPNPADQQLDIANVEMNADEMSYNALMQFEAQQGDVLTDRWNKVHDKVLSVSVLKV